MKKINPFLTNLYRTDSFFFFFCQVSKTIAFILAFLAIWMSEVEVVLFVTSDEHKLLWKNLVFLVSPCTELDI